jgi:hypothetical protein
MMVTKTGSHHVLYVCKPCETRGLQGGGGVFSLSRGACTVYVCAPPARPPARDVRRVCGVDVGDVGRGREHGLWPVRAGRWT